MSQPTELPEPAANAVDLRAALEQMRKEAKREINRLNRKLMDREHEAETRVVSATESIALQQELATLQQTLRQKEETLDRITEECRRLEDQLEDQHVVFDGLRQEVERKETSLKEAREEVLRLQGQLATIQQQSADLSSTSDPVRGWPRGASSREPPTAQAPGPGAIIAVTSFSMGILSALVAVGVVGLLMWGVGGLSWTGEQPAARLARTTDPEVGPHPRAQPAGQESPPDGAVPAAPVRPQPQTPSIVRDRLADGGSAPALSMLPGGSLRMGQNTLAGGDTGPEREVQVAAFGIGIHEVTFEQYDRYARATGRRLPNDFGWGRGDRPVVGVSWSDARAYVEWLSRQTGKGYRLPSEAEWELAARGGGRGSYWWGFGLEPGRAACFDCGSPFDNRATAPVGTFPPSRYGLYDTAGNVMEWVADCYHPSYEGAPGDGRAREDGDCRLRVARGGAFNKPAASMRVYVRTKLDPGTRLNNLGFRVARDP